MPDMGVQLMIQFSFLSFFAIPIEHTKKVLRTKEYLFNPFL